MTKVVSDLLTNVDSGSPSLLLSLDISAVFDTLNHKLLLYNGLMTCSAQLCIVSIIVHIPMSLHGARNTNVTCKLWYVLVITPP